MATKTRGAAVLPPLAPATKARIKAAAAQLARAQGLIEARMRQAQRAPNVGAVRLTLAASGGFYAAAFPDRLSAMDQARAALAAQAKAKASGQVVGLDDVTRELEAAHTTAVATGAGATAIEAIEALLVALQIREAK